MPVLSNPRHERFAQELAKGKTQGDAYRAAGYDAEGHAAESAGNRLLKNVDVQARIAELQERGAEKAAVTVESLVLELEEARTQAKEIKQPSAAVQATIGKAKLLGLIVEKKEDVTPRRHSDQIDARIRQLLAAGNERGASESAGGAGAVASGDKTVPTVPGHGTA